jgi:transposase
MGKSHPVELRERAVLVVEQGNTHTEAARRLCVSIKFVKDMVRLKRETGSLSAKPQGNPGRGKLKGVKDWVQGRIAAQPDLTIDELTAELAAERGLKVHRSSVGRLLHRLGLSHKKKTCKRLSRSARTSPTCVASGSPNANLSWPTIWKD